MTRTVLGVDGGATKTVALVADLDGSVLGAARSGSSDIHAAPGPEAAVLNVAAAAREAATTAGIEPGDVAASVFCLCGADWPEDAEHYAGALAGALVLPAPPTVVNDAFAPLRAGTADGVGVALVLGTGAAIAARGPAGDTWFSGERMEASGAVELGWRAYELLIRGAYGPGPRPRFEPAALAAYSVETVEDLVHAVWRVGGPGRPGLARLAPVLLEAGHAREDVAVAVIREHAGMLASYLRAAAGRVGLEAPGTRVVLSGGLLRHHCTDLVDLLAAQLERFEIRRATVEPVYGALLMAADEAAARPSLARWLASGPGAAFFETL